MSLMITLSHQTAWYITPDNRLNMDKLMAAFQQFYQEHSAYWLERFQYKEAGPQLLLLAFFQRVDLLVLWPLEPAQDDKPDWKRLFRRAKKLSKNDEKGRLMYDISVP